MKLRGEVKIRGQSEKRIQRKTSSKLLQMVGNHFLSSLQSKQFTAKFDDKQVIGKLDQGDFYSLGAASSRTEQEQKR